MEKERQQVQSWEDLLKPDEVFQDYDYPRVSIIIPAYNNSEKIPLTIDSILNQHYPDLELIIVDAMSTDRTLEVIKNYQDERIHTYSVSGYARYEMLNKGISQATGLYINCLFPGDFYIHPNALRQVMRIALNNNKPDLVYCGTLIRDGRSDPKILLRTFTVDLLMRGQQPTSLQSCWFLAESLRSLGKFQTEYHMRGGFDLMCRFSLHPDLVHVSTSHVLTDYDLRLVTLSMVWCHFIETARAINQHFGFLVLLKWFFTQKDMNRVLKIFFRKVRVAFFGG